MNTLNEVIQDVAGYFDTEVTGVEVESLAALGTHAPEAGVVVLRDGDRILKVDAEEYAAVYAATFGDYDIAVEWRTHRDALPKLAATAARLGKADFARELKRYSVGAADCVHVEDEGGQPWKPETQELAAASAVDQQVVAAEVEAFFADKGPATR